MLGLSIQHIPKVNQNKHIECISREFRIDGIASAGSLLISTLLSNVSAISEMRIGEPIPEISFSAVEEENKQNNTTNIQTYI